MKSKSTPAIEKIQFDRNKADLRNLKQYQFGECSFEAFDNLCDIHFSQNDSGIISIDMLNSGDNAKTVLAELKKELGYVFDDGTYSVMRHGTTLIAYVDSDEIDCAERLANIAICAASRVHWDELDEEESNNYRSVI